MKFRIFNNPKVNNREFIMFKIASVFFKLTPILFVVYLYFNSTMTGTDFLTPLTENINITIIFIVAMLGPFCGICVDTAIDNLREKKNIRFSKILLGVIALSQLVAGNMIGVALLGVGLYRAENGPKINFNEFKGQLKERKSRTSITICTFVVIISIVCRYAIAKIA